MKKSNNESNELLKLSLSESEMENLISILESFIQENSDPSFEQFSNRMKLYMANQGKEERSPLKIPRSDLVLMMQLLTSYIADTQEIPKDYYSEIVAAQNELQ